MSEFATGYNIKIGNHAAKDVHFESGRYGVDTPYKH
jgi:hypothetical protein